MYGEIQRPDKSFAENLVMCKYCKCIFKFNGLQPENLKRHKCFVNWINDRDQNDETSVDSDVWNEMTLVICSKWIVENFLPVTAIDDKSFLNMVKFFVNTGAHNRQKTDILDVMPCSTDISQYINQKAADKKTELKDLIGSKVKTGCALTLAKWTDNSVKTTCITVVIHFVHNAQLKELVLGVSDLKEHTSADTLDRIRKMLLKAFDICDKDVDSMVFITDINLGLKFPLDGYFRLNCSHHLLTNLVEKAFADTTEIEPLFNNCVILVKYFRTVNLLHLLDTSSVANFGLSNRFKLFNIIDKSWPKIVEALDESDQQDG